METWGARGRPQPVGGHHAGRAISSSDPDSPGSLGIAISEAVEDAAEARRHEYSLGSVLNHVLLHQTVIGQEAQRQIELAGEYPDVVIGCVGGGSNFAGLAFPFVRDKIAGARSRSSPASPRPARRSPAAPSPTTSATRLLEPE